MIGILFTQLLKDLRVRTTKNINTNHPSNDRSSSDKSHPSLSKSSARSLLEKKA